MNKFLISIIFIGLFVENAAAVFNDWQVGVRPNGMAGAYIAVADDITAVRWNPAGLVLLDYWQGAICTSLRGDGDCLKNLTFSLGRKFGKWGGAVVSAQRIAFDLETDQSIALSQGMDLTNRLAFGYNLNLYRLWQESLGFSKTVGIDLGLLGKIYRTWRIGCFGHNLNHPSIGQIHKYDLPSGVGLGFSGNPFTMMMFSVEMVKDVGRTARYKLGTEYGLGQEKINLRAGIYKEGSLTGYAMGLGLNIKKIAFDYALGDGSRISGRHQFGLGYKWQ